MLSNVSQLKVLDLSKKRYYNLYQRPSLSIDINNHLSTPVPIHPLPLIAIPLICSLYVPKITREIVIRLFTDLQCTRLDRT